jgi:group I intron endonuclease
MSAIIYCITNTVNGKCYIGQTIRPLHVRWQYHCDDVRRGSTTHFHRAIRKYGAESFAVEIVEETTTSQLNDRERHWIAKLQPAYNMTSGGEGHAGPLTPEHRENISLALRGKPRKPLTPEHRAKISAVQFGKKRGPRHFTEEHRAKLSAANRGVSKTPEHRAKLREAALRRIEKQRVLQSNTRQLDPTLET